MTYSEKVKRSKELLSVIQSLEDNEIVKVIYGKGYDGTPNVYAIKAYASSKGVMSYSIWNSFRGMNVNKIGRTSLSLYTYDMMSQKTTYRMSLLDIEYGE